MEENAVADRLPCPNYKMQEEEMFLRARPRRTPISSMLLLAVSVSLGSSPEQRLPLNLLRRW
jgi:hypothetical protein